MIKFLDVDFLLKDHFKLLLSEKQSTWQSFSKSGALTIVQEPCCPVELGEGGCCKSKLERYPGGAGRFLPVEILRQDD